MLQLAFYRGPASSMLDQLAHKAICLVTGSKYSHVELVIDGTCCSSSARDGGVRTKRIDLTSGKWDVVQVAGDEGAAWRWFIDHIGQRYDYAGVARFIVPLLPTSHDQWFCSEAVADALGMVEPGLWTPGMLAERFKQI